MRTNMKIGITGGIGSGKSYICNMLEAQGFPVYNCDDKAKRLMVENILIINAIRELIGAESYMEECDNEGHVTYILNKPVIASFLFANMDNASKVNSIVHPVVKEDFKLWSENQHSNIVFMECAILFESGFQDTVDKTVLIYADENIRMHRAMKRDKSTEKQIRSRMSHQISGDEAVRRADYVLNHNDYCTTEDEVQKMINWIKNTTL